jgi:hypothetical protein
MRWFRGTQRRGQRALQRRQVMVWNFGSEFRSDFRELSFRPGEGRRRLDEAARLAKTSGERHNLRLNDSQGRSLQFTQYVEYFYSVR